MRWTINRVEQEETQFDNCRSCGGQMRTISSQILLVATFPEWNITDLVQMRRMLRSIGVHDVYEVEPGLCEYCSPGPVGSDLSARIGNRISIA